MIVVPIVQKDSHNEMLCFHGISLISHDKGNVIFLPVSTLPSLVGPVTPPPAAATIFGEGVFVHNTGLTTTQQQQQHCLSLLQMHRPL